MERLEITGNGHKSWGSNDAQDHRTGIRAESPWNLKIGWPQSTTALTHGEGK